MSSSEFRAQLAGDRLHRVRAAVGLRTRIRRASVRARGFGRGIYVLGMHRSGTSAAARIVNGLGIPIGDPDDLIGAEPDSNPTGHWESRALTAFNDRLLQLQGGTWSRPPDLPDGWQDGPVMRSLADDARQTFARIHPHRTWMWKDPRLCLTLQFWRSVLSARSSAVLVVRNPLEVARSLAARNGFGEDESLALWETYNRSALRAVDGMPVLVTTYESLLADPVRWSAALAAFLTSAGYRLTAKPAQVDGFVDRTLRHATFDAQALHRPSVTPAQRDLYNQLLELRSA